MCPMDDNEHYIYERNHLVYRVCNALTDFRCSTVFLSIAPRACRYITVMSQQISLPNMKAPQSICRCPYTKRLSFRTLPNRWVGTIVV